MNMTPKTLKNIQLHIKNTEARLKQLQYAEKAAAVNRVQSTFRSGRNLRKFRQRMNTSRKGMSGQGNTMNLRRLPSDLYDQVTQQSGLNNKSISALSATSTHHRNATYHRRQQSRTRNQLNKTIRSNEMISDAPEMLQTLSQTYDHTIDQLMSSDNLIFYSDAMMEDSEFDFIGLGFAIRINPRLQMLLLGNITITSCPNGHAAIFANALKVHRTLKTLSLTDLSISPPCLKVVLDALNSLNTLNLSSMMTPPPMNVIADFLTDHRTLKALIVTDCNISNANPLGRALEQNASLRNLDLSNNALTAEGVKGIAKALPHSHELTSLDLHNNNISLAGAAHLAEGLDQSGVNRLDLTGNPIPQDALTILREALPRNARLFADTA